LRGSRAAFRPGLWKLPIGAAQLHVCRRWQPAAIGDQFRRAQLARQLAMALPMHALGLSQDWLQHWRGAGVRQLPMLQRRLPLQARECVARPVSLVERVHALRLHARHLAAASKKQPLTMTLVFID
jgi:hypothetical protein